MASGKDGLDSGDATKVRTGNTYEKVAFIRKIALHILKKKDIVKRLKQG